MSVGCSRNQTTCFSAGNDSRPSGGSPLIGSLASPICGGRGAVGVVQYERYRSGSHEQSLKGSEVPEQYVNVLRLPAFRFRIGSTPGAIVAHRSSKRTASTTTPAAVARRPRREAS